MADIDYNIEKQHICSFVKKTIRHLSDKAISVNPHSHSTMNLTFVNAFIYANIKKVEMIGVLMRIISFTLVSWLGPESPFLFIWIFNTIDALMLSWCAILKKDNAYTLLNVFWVIIGIVGVVRAASFFH